MNPRESHPHPFDHGTTSVHFREIAPTLQEELAIALKAGWQIEPISGIGQDGSKPKISSNNFRVVNQQGSYLLKLSHVNTAETQHVINTAICYCKTQGTPTAVVIPTKTGELFFVHEDQVFCLFDFIEGEHFDGSREEVIDTATRLVHFNQVLETLPDQDKFAQLQSVAHHDWDILDRFTNQIRSTPPTTAFDQELAAVLDEIELASQDSRLAQLQNLPSQVVHIDLHPHNLLFDPHTKNLLAFLDFDSLFYTQRIRGVAFAMHRLARTFGIHTERNHDTGASIQDRAELFLTSYTQTGELTPEELKAIPLVIIDEALRRILIILTSHYINKDNSYDSVLQKQLTILHEASLLS